MKLGMTFVCMLSFISMNSFAEEPLRDPLLDVHVSRSEIEQSLNKMKADGKINSNDHIAAIEALKKMDESSINNMNETAKNMVRKDPDKADALWKAPAVDTNKVQAMLND